MTAATTTTPLDPFVLYRYNAAFCWFDILWTGKDLMFMKGTGVRLCKISGKLTTRHFGTEVNPRGATEADKWIQDCWNYIPDGVLLTFEELQSMPNTSWANMSIQDLKQMYNNTTFLLKEKRDILKGRPVLYDHWAFGSPSEIKKKNRQQWRNHYAARKAYQSVSEAEFFQLKLRGLSLPITL